MPYLELHKDFLYVTRCYKFFKLLVHNMSKKDSEMSTTAEPKAPKSPREDDKKDKKDKRKAAADDKASKGSSTTEIKATNNSDTPSLDRKQESRLDLKTVVYGTGKSFENCGK